MEELKLTDSQRRSLQASLLLFEKSLRSVDRLLSDGNETGILYQQTMNLDQETVLKIKNRIAFTLIELEEFT
ncbi:MAG: hypothetical protein KKB74_04640, partial [Bacteroidetes bacterium]|nr:hypothetical protein [Bacteroidota bacterium]